MFCKHEIGDLLFAGRVEESRSHTLETLKQVFDLKLLIYFLMSFFSEIVKLYRRIRGYKHE